MTTRGRRTPHKSSQGGRRSDATAKYEHTSRHDPAMAVHTTGVGRFDILVKYDVTRTMAKHM